MKQVMRTFETEMDGSVKVEVLYDEYGIYLRRAHRRQVTTPSGMMAYKWSYDPYIEIPYMKLDMFADAMGEAVWYCGLLREEQGV